MKEYGILDQISSPADVKKLEPAELDLLCGMIREFLIDHVARTGGHLASNLGVVELSVALARAFDPMRDRIIYDVGHQCYVHKLLTGRRDQFDTLRQSGGLCGFMKPSESEADPCITGHASSSVSVALGMARARTLRGEKYSVVAVIGDGALTGGMAYEALANAGTSEEPLIVVLNDNNMSIDKNVGGMARHLARLRVSSRYLNAKNAVRRVLTPLPGGKSLLLTGSKLKSMIKSALLPVSMFEQMGFHYLGPVDGHDLKALDDHLQVAKRLKKPVLIHVMTKKGKGYVPAEGAPEKFHGVSKFNPYTGEPLEKPGESFSSVFGEELLRLARKDGRICAVTAAMPSGTGLSAFAAAFPDRFFDVGIAEEHAVAMTAGMVKQGLRPVCAIYSTFLQRGYDQLIHDLAIEGTIPAVFAVDRAGIVGADGATHNGVFDVAYLRSIPGMRLLAPANFAELRAMLTQALYHSDRPTAVRYPRGGEGDFREDASGAPTVPVFDGADAVIVSYGIMINHAIRAAEILHERGVSAAVWKLNELSEPFGDAFLAEIGRFRTVVVLEDVVARGSVGEALAAALLRAGYAPARLLLRNTGDRFLPHGSVKEIERLCGIDAESVAAAVLEENK